MKVKGRYYSASKERPQYTKSLLIWLLLVDLNLPNEVSGTKEVPPNICCSENFSWQNHTLSPSEQLEFKELKKGN